VEKEEGKVGGKGIKRKSEMCASDRMTGVVEEEVK
jgi:hypothetical protein